jgi:peptide-methionine (S)-S-oxide reductase
MKNKDIETATFGAGCFWGVEDIFMKIKGVVETAVGYMGGNEKKYPNPTYRQVCSDRTGYVEVTQIKFNPKKISYEELLKIFWKIHDPTTMNRQGPDFGSQYKSVIFYENKSQKDVAEKSKKEAQKKFDKKIATEIKKAGTFFRAEEYHQKYILKNGLASCHV